MTTQIIFKIDEKTKRAAQIKAKKEGITLSSFYQQATRSFIAGEVKTGFIQGPEIPNAKTAREWNKATKDIKIGRNLSPSFTRAEDAIAYLKKYAG